MSTIKEKCKGRWPAILRSFGLSEKELSGNHGPCPMCGGKDRFRFDNKEGDGTYFCSGCGAGDGLDLLQKYKGWDFKTCAGEVEKIVGSCEPEKPRQAIDQGKVRQAMNYLWRGANQYSREDAVGSYLENRGLVFPSGFVTDLRYHSKCSYHEEGNRYSHHPAMLAKVTGPDGAPATIHRTFLTAQGKKANVEKSRLLMPGKIPKGSAIRLFEPRAQMGIAEGIETALSAALIYKMPVWAAMSTTMMMHWEPPEDVEDVIIFGDNDENFAGQAAAFSLANRLCSVGNYVSVKVMIPDEVGDWNDYLISQKA